jgi:hypothetical protein|tara:strand:+ start:748 stop:972 length:225 start_codon:yes stop_codon:yes gene_type:complete
MDIKSMLVKLAEAQAEKLQEEAMDHITSDDFNKMLATKINEKVNLPWINEEKEQELFEKLVDVMTDMLKGVFKK